MVRPTTLKRQQSTFLYSANILCVISGSMHQPPSPKPRMKPFSPPPVLEKVVLTCSPLASPAHRRGARTWIYFEPTTRISVHIRISRLTIHARRNGTHIEQERNWHTHRRQDGKYGARPRVPEVPIHSWTYQRKYRGDYRPKDHGGSYRARAVNRVGIHQVLREALHHYCRTHPKRYSGEDGDNPGHWRIACPIQNAQSVTKFCLQAENIRTMQTSTN